MPAAMVTGSPSGFPLTMLNVFENTELASVPSAAQITMFSPQFSSLAGV